MWHHNSEIFLVHNELTPPIHEQPSTVYLLGPFVFTSIDFTYILSIAIFTIMNTPNVFSYVVFMTFFMTLPHQNEEFFLFTTNYTSNSWATIHSVSVRTFCFYVNRLQVYTSYCHIHRNEYAKCVFICGFHDFFYDAHSSEWRIWTSSQPLFNYVFQWGIWGYLLQYYLNHEWILSHPLSTFFLTVVFILNEQLSFIQIIVCVNTISLPLSIFVYVTDCHFFLNACLECHIEGLTMFFAVFANFFCKLIEGYKPFLWPSTWQEICIWFTALLCFVGGLCEPRRLPTRSLLVICLVTIMTKQVNDTYWYVHNVFCSFLSFLSFPSCTIINNTKVNECFIWDSKKLVCHFGILVVVPECYSSHGWTKVDVELDVCICIAGVSFHCHCGLHCHASYIFAFPDPSCSTNDV